MSTFTKIDLSSATVKGIFPTILKTSFDEGQPKYPKFLFHRRL